MGRVVVVVVALAACWSGAPSSMPPPALPPPPVVRSAPRPAPLDEFDQSTPHATLASFVRAAEHDRYDVIPRFIPDRYREAVTEAALRARKSEIDDVLVKVRPHLDDAIVETGDTARLDYGNGLSIQFVREDGTWRIVDFD